MDSPSVQLPNMARIRIITEHDDIVAALDKKKAAVGLAGLELPEDQREKVAYDIDEICQQQAALLKQARSTRATVCTLVEAGAYWLALQALQPGQAEVIKQSLEPTVQRMREHRDKQETRQ